MNNELAGIKFNINATNMSINAMKDSMDTHLKTVTDTMDTCLKTFTDTIDTRLKTFMETMQTFTNKMDSGLKTTTNSTYTLLKTIITVSILFSLLAVANIALPYVYQWHYPSQDDTHNNHPSSESTQTLTSMFRNLATRKDSKVHHIATEGKPAIAYVDAGDEDYLFTEASITCQLMSALTGAVTECSVQYIVTRNQYEISYQATSRGRHQLHIKVEEEYIKGSPFPVTVIRKIGTPIKIIDNMGAPQGIAFSQQNEMVVAEYREHQITIISPSLDIDKRFGSGGTEDGQFNHPCGVAVDDDGSILVTDQKNGRIQKFNSHGKYITKVNGNHDTHSLELGQPVGIGIHPHTKMIYVTDIKHHRVQILDPDLKYSSSFGSKGKGNGLFDQPKDVAFDSAGNVYIADNENHRIQVFTKTGQYLRKFGGNGNLKGDLYYPSSISIDSEDVIYVTELYNYRVSMFTLQGDLLHCFGSKGSGEGEFSDPRGINVDKNGIVYVSDHDNDRIQVF